MNRLLSITFITIILLNSAEAGQRQKKAAEAKRREANMTEKQLEKKHHEQEQQRQHELAPKEIRNHYPGSFGSCGTEEDHENFDVYINVLKSAKSAGVEIPHAPTDVSILTLDNCTVGYADGHWAKFAYETSEETCAFVIAVSYKGIILESDNYFLDVERTSTINKVPALSHCTPKQAEVAKVTVDIQEETDEALEKEIVAEELKKMHEEIINNTTHKDVHTTHEVVPQPEKHETTPTHHEEHTPEQGIITPAKVEPVIETIIPSFGPARLRIPAHNQEGKQQPNERATPSHTSDHEDFGESMHNLFKEPLVGGWSLCNPEEYPLAKQVIALLLAQQKIVNVGITSENVSRCYHQLVNGMNYNTELSINGQKCQLAFHKEIRGELSTLTGAPSLGEPLCIEVYKNPNADV